MARALLVGCGCCARGAGRLLTERGWSVRGTSRGERGRARIEAAGIEAAEADPDRVGSVVELLGDVTVPVWALGAPAGGDGELEKLQLQRLPSLLEKLVDTPVRGFVWESSLPADADLARRAGALLEDAERRWHLPMRTVAAARADHASWAQAVADAVEAVISPSR